MKSMSSPVPSRSCARSITTCLSKIVCVTVEEPFVSDSKPVLRDSIAGAIWLPAKVRYSGWWVVPGRFGLLPLNGANS